MHGAQRPKMLSSLFCLCWYPTSPWCQGPVLEIPTQQNILSWQSHVVACRSGFCVLLHLFKGVTGFTSYLIAVIERCAPLAVSTSIFPPCRELLRGNGPEMKRNFVMFCLETGQRQNHREMPKASCRFLNVVGTSESASSTTMNRNPSDMELSLKGPCFR